MSTNNLSIGELLLVVDAVRKASSTPWVFLEIPDHDGRVLDYEIEDTGDGRTICSDTAYYPIAPDADEMRAIVLAINFLRDHGQAVADALIAARGDT